jgi:hypothetical protein
VARMKDIFKPKRLIAGAEVLQALAAEFRLENKDMYFTRDGGDIAWLLSYIGEKGTLRAFGKNDLMGSEFASIPRRNPGEGTLLEVP